MTMERFYCLRDLSVEEGFAICTGFFSALYPQIKADLQSLEKEKQENISFFCRDLCNGKESFAEWNEAVFHATGIPKEQQKNAVITADQIFQSLIEFCTYYNNLLEHDLDYILNLLHDMRKPQVDLLKEMITKSRGRVLAISFNWNDEITDTLSVEQAYRLCGGFFVGLWPLLTPRLPPSEDDPIYVMHDIFVMNICLDDDSCAEWNESVFRATKIAKEQQKSTQLTLEQTFSSMLEFCRYFNKQYEGKLNILVALIEKMRENPEQFKQEWDLFNKNAAWISTVSYFRFNWRDDKVL